MTKSKYSHPLYVQLVTDKPINSTTPTPPLPFNFFLPSFPPPPQRKIKKETKGIASGTKSAYVNLK